MRWVDWGGSRLGIGARNILWIAAGGGDGVRLGIGAGNRLGAGDRLGRGIDWGGR